MGAQIWARDRDGRDVIRRTDLMFDGAHYVYPRSACADADGSLIVSLEAWSRGGEVSTLLCRVRPPGRITDVIRTESFLAQSLTVGPEGRIWAFGAKPVLEWKRDAEYNTLETYDASGRLIWSTLPKSSFVLMKSGAGQRFAPTRPEGMGWSKIMRSSSRIVIYSSSAEEYLEYDFSGRMLTRLAVPRPTTPDGKKALEAAELAMTQSNDLYGWIQRSADCSEPKAIT
jgi:hypothetical protein